MRRRHIAASLTLVALLTSTGPAYAQAGHLPTTTPRIADEPDAPPAPFTTWDELWLAQERLNDAAEQIDAAAEAASDDRRASTIADPTIGSLILYWKGTPSAAVQQAIASARQTVPVTLIASAPYTAKELAAEAARIAASSPRFAGVTPRPDASGLTVQWLDGQQDPQVAADTIARASVDVVFDSKPALGLPERTSRQDDAAPYRGGALTQTAIRYCTASFSISHPTQGRAMLYAAHCASSGEQVWDGGGQLMGTVINRNASRDVSAIKVSSNQGQVWDGGPQSNFAKAVYDAHPSRVGNYFCTSGAFTGVVCGGKVTAVDFSYSTFSHLVVWEHPEGKAMIGGGDSGGPAYALHSTGKVVAQGIIHGGMSGQTATCIGTPGGTGRTCYKKGYFADVRGTIDWMGWSIVKG